MCPATIGKRAAFALACGIMTAGGMQRANEGAPARWRLKEVAD